MFVFDFAPVVDAAQAQLAAGEGCTSTFTFVPARCTMDAGGVFRLQLLLDSAESGGTPGGGTKNAIFAATREVSDAGARSYWRLFEQLAGGR